MDKKREMNFNLNNFLLALSLACDLKRKELFSSSPNYSKRVAYIALNMAKELNYTPEEMSDLCSYSLVHSIGLLNNDSLNKKYLISSQKISQNLPFLLENKDVLLYQKEFLNGSGVFGLRDDEIHKISKILSFSILLNEEFDLGNSNIENKNKVIEFVKRNSNILFETQFEEIFMKVSKNISFWLDLENENDMLYFIFGNLYDFSTILTFEKVLDITKTLYETINPKSNLLNLVSKVCDFYSFDHKDKFTFSIAASLTNIGKASIPSKILNKSSKLEDNEYELIKAYPYYTKKILSNIMGFNDITLWASRVQERLDSNGYPYGLKAKDLSLKDRILSILVIYDSLRNEKPYRASYTKEEAINIINSIEGLDKAILKDLEELFE